MRITKASRDQAETRLRASMERLLAGPPPAGGKCDLKTLAADANVTRSALYTTYQHIKDEFQHRLERDAMAGHITDPRDGQIQRLKQHLASLRERLSGKDQELKGLNDFRITALSQLAAQHQEILRLRTLISRHGKIHLVSD